jgi:glyceraldehyde 3-phosphate dehydrogenase
MIRIAINGFGRIGRNVLRALYESGYRNRMQIVAINDLGDLDTSAHLLRYDTVHGRFAGHVSTDLDALLVNGDRISYFQSAQPVLLPWRELKIDVVLECTGRFTKREQALAHVHAGAGRVLISAPGDDVDATVVHGVNHQVLKKDHLVVSNASCTTNCLAPVAKVLNDAIGIEQGMMTTIHAYTNDQQLLDLNHKDVYRARSATQSMIPTKTGAAKAVGLVLPELKGRLDGMAVRVPTINVSLVDLNVLLKRETSVDEINQLMRDAAHNELRGILRYNEEPLVSIDFNHDSASSSFDATQTKVNGRWVKLMAWYDNEWGFSHRMLDNALNLAALSQRQTERDLATV